jgi:hypothetical protein
MLLTGDRVTLTYLKSNVTQTKMIISKEAYEIIKQYEMPIQSIIVVGSPLWYAVEHSHAPFGCFVQKIGDNIYPRMIKKLKYEKVGG